MCDMAKYFCAPLLTYAGVSRFGILPFYWDTPNGNVASAATGIDVSFSVI